MEWPTLVLIASVYGSWLLAVAFAHALGPVVTCALLAVIACWFTSLQHELLHGHPTRWRPLNRCLGILPLAVWYPYDFYRVSHLAHHRDERVTYPQFDPESNYIAVSDYAALSRCHRVLRRTQRTLAGRMLIGPALVIVPLWMDIVRKPWRGDFAETRTWVEHLVLLAVVLWALDRHAGIGPLQYLLLVGYPALGLALLRSFYEHRPADDPAHRVVVNEAGWFWRVLFLNNNYHAIHHEQPHLPWYRIRAHYLADREGVLRRNGGFLVPGYGSLLRRHAVRAVDSPIHPSFPHE
jgi:fatty acid desaturase